MEKTPVYLKGGFWSRLVAFIFDEVLILVGLFILFVIFDLIGIRTEGFEKIIFWILSIAYNTVFIWKSGATIGKRWLRLRVVTTEYKPVSFGQALLRESLGKLYSTIVLNLGYLHALKNPQRQTWHDKMVKTYVVVTDNKGTLIPTTEEVVTKRDKMFYWILFSVAIIPLLLAIFIVVYLFFVQPHQIKGKAMLPNYVDSEYYLTTRVYGELRRGDVIVFRAPKDPGFDLFKRIVGLPGEEIEIRDGKVYVNGNAAVETYLLQGTYTRGGSFIQEGQRVTVPQGQYFVLGDNRDYSSDSREVGFIPKESIVGKMTICYWNCAQK